MREETVEKKLVAELIEKNDQVVSSEQPLTDLASSNHSANQDVAAARFPIPSASPGEAKEVETIEWQKKKPSYKLLLFCMIGGILLFGLIIGHGLLTHEIARERLLNARTGWVFLVYGSVLFGNFGLLFWLEKRMSRMLSLKLRNDSIEFSNDWRLELLKRTTRSWNDVQSIDIVALSNPVKRPFYMVSSLYDTAYGAKLFIDFTSGGSASISLHKLDDHTKTLLFKTLGKRVPLTKFSGAAVRLKEQLLSDVSDTSYTELWIDDVSMRHASTNFVPLPSGHMIASGKMRVVAELASGGLSAVYLVESEDRKTKMVLKESVLPLDMNEDSKMKARELFHREAKLLSGLNHPNIVKVHDFFVERGRDYLLLQHIPGRTLRQVVAEGPLPEARAVEIAIRIADIIAYLHEQAPPVVHRDLTPDNILIRNDGEVVLIDFGAANQFVGQATGTMVGKKSYIPPEQFRGKAEPVSDIYALGATLFFMLTAKDPMALSTSTIGSEFKVSKQVGVIVEKCTQMEALDRYPNIELVKQALVGAHHVR